jgi:NTE family protein
MQRGIIVLLILIILTLPLFSAPKVALVLSGGGARGFAHIPVIEAIEEAGIPIDFVLGTSMGSLIGGLYAAGYTPQEIRTLIDENSMVDLFASTPLPPIPKASLLNDQRCYNIFQIGLDQYGVGSTSGMLGDQKILQMLNSALCRVATIDNFDELAIPFRAIGANLVNGEKIVFSEGSIVRATRSSISIPGVFAPYPVDGKLVVDGGVVDNLPIDLAKEMGADIVIAVDVNGEDYKTTAEDLDSLTAVLEQTVIIFMKNTYVNQLKSADILIVPPLGDYSTLDFLSVKEILKIGEETAAQHQGEFAQLAAQIGEERELLFLDKGRQGSYFKLQEPYISQIVHRPMGNGGREISLKAFNQFVGLAMGEEQKATIQHELDNLRKIGQFSTATCELVDVVYNSQGEVWGVLEVQTRQFTPKRSTISLGIYGTTSLTFNPTKFEVTPNIALKYNREDLFKVPLTLALTLTLTDTLQIGGEITYNFSPNWSAGIDVNYTGGALLPQHLRYGKVGLEFRDHKGEGSLLVRYRRQEKLLIQLTNSYPYYWFETTPKSEIFSPSLRLDAYYSTLNSTIIPLEGLRLDLSLGGEIWGYSALIRYQQMVRLARHHYLYFDLRGESSRPLAPQAISFITLGGGDGVPSHLATTLTDDLVIGRIKYLFVMGERPIPFVLHTMVTLQSYGQIMRDESSSPSITPFSSLNGIESSLSLAVGFPLGSLEFLFGIALDTTLRTTIFLEVL